jgi:glutamate 5-kinase
MKEKRVVIKMGTASITDESGRINQEKIKELSHSVAQLQKEDYQVVIVSSGAIGAGMHTIGHTIKPETLLLKQATAAIGQAVLMQHYRDSFLEEGLITAQILLTNDVIKDDIKKQNVSRTMEALLDLKVVPIVNENDTVSTEEIDGILFSDNDQLASIVVSLLEASLLVLFSNVEGLYQKKDNVLSDQIIEVVEDIEDIIPHISNKNSSLGRGGMASKINAIKGLTKQGVDVVLTSSSHLIDLKEIVSHKAIGTLFKGV